MSKTILNIKVGLENNGKIGVYFDNEDGVTNLDVWRACNAVIEVARKVRDEQGIPPETGAADVSGLTKQ